MNLRDTLKTLCFVFTRTSTERDPASRIPKLVKRTLENDSALGARQLDSTLSRLEFTRFTAELRVCVPGREEPSTTLITNVGDQSSRSFAQIPLRRDDLFGIALVDHTYVRDKWISGASGNRTRGLYDAIVALSHLSYCPIVGSLPVVTPLWQVSPRSCHGSSGAGGIEPPMAGSEVVRPSAIHHEAPRREADRYAEFCRG